ncbi:MAG TPA: hypothetical protein VG759_04445 [Candidatus Angelobacter sp.]|jgi:hypothetical protein|nr:hypothetical protein [Candidatus Angelobacter sp.]
MKRIQAVLALLVLLIPSLAVAGAKQQTFKLRLSTDAIVSDGTKKHGFSGSWRIYDRQGRLVAEISGGDDNFRASLDFVLKSPSPLGVEKTLDWELGRLEEQDGGTLKKLPEADFTMVKYFDKACDYCKAADERSYEVVESVLKSHPDRAVNILHVEIDIKQRVEELKKKGLIRD